MTITQVQPGSISELRTLRKELLCRLRSVSLWGNTQCGTEEDRDEGTPSWTPNSRSELNLVCLCSSALRCRI